MLALRASTRGSSESLGKESMNLSKISIITRAALWIKENPTPPRITGAGFFVITAIFGMLWLTGLDVEPVTFALSLCSTFFFALPAIADLVVNQKAISEMSYDELMNYISGSDSKKDWKSISADGKEEFFCLHDTRLRIRHHSGDDGVQNDDFKESWANSFPDEHAYGLWYDIVYESGCIRRFLIVAVDGFRAYLPCPSRPAHTITRLQDKIGQIIAMHDTLYEEYKSRAKIKISETEA